MKKALVLITILALAAGTAGAADPASDFRYEFNEAGDGVVITRYLKDQETVLIPDTIKDHPVTELRGAFLGKGKLKAVTLPENLEILGDSAFRNCSALVSVIIPGGVTLIGDWAFFGCRVLSAVTIPSGLTAIGNGAFSYCGVLISVTIPDSVTAIGSQAFFGCEALAAVDLNPHAIEFGYNAFSGCSRLPRGVREKIEDSGYRGRF
jgi:hypothetical protein